ncbi:MOSC domain-containing protein [Vannielia litorea]|uniref:MOSC domain-containing protein n=1 Tax=Vannielia litorea TaxID=1217970 RepID=UPI001C982330|nr:MOSC domain-containing protein [Vannielia litorea]MBY6048182.1 MOSC domain-containing protein [Vannielia litorea]MBY6075596.1 MOSC domain-containing protein [Vannielia litorea]
MAGLKKIDATATVTWLGWVESREATLRSEPLGIVDATLEGFPGEDHGGATRPSCSRVLALYPERGTPIRNTRQLSILSTEELAEIAQTLGLEELSPDLLGASLILSGLPDFSHIPPGTRLQAPSGATITVDLENGPCNFPAKEIEETHPGHGKGFKAAAMGKRGVTAWIEREGRITVGDTLTVFLPDQPAWAGT